MDLNFIEWMNSTINFEAARLNITLSHNDEIDEIEKIETDAANSETLKTTLVKWLNYFYSDFDDEMYDNKPFHYFLLKSQGIEIAVETIFHNTKLQTELEKDNLLFNLFEKYLNGTPLIHQRISDLILINSFTEFTDEYENYVNAVKKLINTLKMDYNELELKKERENIADEIAFLNGNIVDTKVVQLHSKLKDNFESTYKISQENHEIVVSNLDELDVILNDLTELAKTCMIGVDAKKKALNQYYNDKYQKEVEEYTSYDDTIKNMLSQLDSINATRDEHQAKLDSLLIQVSELKKKISELDELKAQINNFVLETTELILTKKENVTKIDKELQDELAGESIQYNINKELEIKAKTLSEIILEIREYLDTKQKTSRNDLKMPCAGERVLNNIMNVKVDNSNSDQEIIDKDEFKRELLVEMTDYKKNSILLEFQTRIIRSGKFHGNENVLLGRTLTMKNNDVLTYLEPVTEQNISMIKMVLLAFNGYILDDNVQGNKALILLKDYGNRPLPILPGFKMTPYDSNPPEFKKPTEVPDTRDIKSLFDKTENNNSYKYDDLFKHYLNPSITIPIASGFLILYTSYKLLELML